VAYRNTAIDRDAVPDARDRPKQSACGRAVARSDEAARPRWAGRSVSVARGSAPRDWRGDIASPARS